MHRGGGFRGPSGGGGFRGPSSGGGFRGPSHSGGYHRPNYGGYGGGYYRRGYYGGYPGFYGGGFRGGFCQCICCIIILVFFVGVMLFAVIGSIGTRSSTLTLLPQETRLFTLSENDKTVNIEQKYGTVQTYFFTNIPARSVSYTENVKDSKELKNEEFVPYYRYFHQGDSATITWNVSIPNYELDFYVIKGDSEYNDFSEGYDFNYDDWERKSSDVYTFSALSSDTFYFVFHNIDYSIVRLNVNIDLHLNAHDVSGAVATYTGDVLDTITGKEYTALVLRNPSTTAECEVDYEIQANNSIMTWFPYVIFGIIALVVVAIIVNANNKHKSMAQPNAAANAPTQVVQTINPTPQSPQTPQTSKPVQRNYTINVCSYCGSALSSEEKALLSQTGKVYCQHCGSEIK